MDAIDYQLVNLLQRNGRMTQMEMASAVGLSQPSVAERLRKLEESKVIVGYAALVDAHKLNKDITAFIGVGIEHPKYHLSFAKRIQVIPDVLECHRVAGEDTYLLKVKTDNTGTLDRLISNLLRTIPGVTRTHTTIVLSSVKETVQVPVLDQKTSGVRDLREGT